MIELRCRQKWPENVQDLDKDFFVDLAMEEANEIIDEIKLENIDLKGVETSHDYHGYNESSIWPKRVVHLDTHVRTELLKSIKKIRQHTNYINERIKELTRRVVDYDSIHRITYIIPSDEENPKNSIEKKMSKLRSLNKMIHMDIKDLETSTLELEEKIYLHNSCIYQVTEGCCCCLPMTVLELFLRNDCKKA